MGNAEDQKRWRDRRNALAEWALAHGAPKNLRPLRKEGRKEPLRKEGSDTAEIAALRAEIAALKAADAGTFSMTVQQRIEAWKRREMQTMKAQYEQRVRDEVKRRIDDIVLPHWKKQIDQAQELYKRRRGAMDKDTFNAIRRGLHPDSRNSISDKKLGEAFNKFMGLEKFLLDEKDSPTTLGEGLPGSWAEWEARKAKVKAERKAKRATGRATVRRA